MGVFGGKSQEVYGELLLKRHDNHEINDIGFLLAFRKIQVYYSTPFGDHKDGGARLFVLPAQDQTAYMPVFTSVERLTEFYEKAGRNGYMIMESTFLSFLETTVKINEGNTPIKLGAIIDPSNYGVTIDARVIAEMTNILKRVSSSS